MVALLKQTFFQHYEIHAILNYAGNICWCCVSLLLCFVHRIFRDPQDVISAVGRHTSSPSGIFGKHLCESTCKPVIVNQVPMFSTQLMNL